MSKNKIILGATGFAQSGKDTFGQYLVEKYGFTRVSFAEPVYESYWRLNPWIPLSYSEILQYEIFGAECTLLRLQDVVSRIGWENAKKIPEVRQGLQRIGTDCGREIHDEDCWINIGKRKFEGLEKVVVSDIRFMNEADAILESGFEKAYIVKVNRSGVGPINDHKSDAGLPQDYIDLELDNSGTIEDLHKNIDKLIEQL